MSAANFRTMDNFPLYAMDLEDEYDLQETFLSVSDAVETVNDELHFHKISVISGYYSGIQLYVEEQHDPNDYDNSDCRYFFDMYRSQAIRRYKSEINKINRKLRRIADRYGFERLACTAVFSNGEAFYERVENTVRTRTREKASVAVSTPSSVPVAV